MLRIECPWCGPRDELEFTYGGQSHVARPSADCSDEAWADYLFVRSNPKGVHAERWCHSYGCGQWFHALRDTVTHRIIVVYRVGEPLPLSADEPI